MRKSVNLGFAILGIVWLGFAFWLTTLVPMRDDARDWFGSLNPGGWMAWTFPSALFFTIIAGLLILFTYLAIRFPETPRKGVLGITTTRGDRLFISLLGSAFICLIWLGAIGTPVWGGLACAIIYAAAVFRWV
ncbi:DUF2160 domain-containing protein [Paracoccus sp. YLB-12]|jgi:predicted small integral membrane protein|uniref:DUF2160 domain-containing protein n=2 Tax=Paracoccus maritimus TaxID=2933292 RepID=A0ABT2K5Z1_9RHOB|nr:DUF2160 domain-containing protein [Paracoccus sp. YLB-12]PHQ69935.1 MAG: glycerol-3-phosphate ABC transporter [Paracoccus sp. (in: a-proteobacteria)]